MNLLHRANPAVGAPLRTSARVPQVDRHLSRPPVHSAHVSQLVLRARPAGLQAGAEPSCSDACEQNVPHQLGASRRSLGLLAVGSAAASAVAAPGPAGAIGFTKPKKRKLTEDDYVMSDDVGLRIAELEEGSGNDRIKAGDKATVHFDCTFRGIDAVSSRAARLLGGNRIIAEPYEFVVGEPVLGQTLKKADAEGGNGLYAGTPGPKPPQALSKAVIGMKKGGKRSILVDNPELGYPKGQLEIPPGATFELKVEVLNFTSRSA